MDEQNDHRFAGMTMLRQERTANANYDLYDDKTVQSIFVDGLAEVLLGSFVSKLNFHVVENAKKGEGENTLLESRVVRARLTIPTTVLIELASQIQALLILNMATLEPPLHQAITSLRALSQSKTE